MNTLEVRLAVMPMPRDVDFEKDKIHVNCDVYLCDKELDNEYRVWVPTPFYGTVKDYHNWVLELTTLANNSGLKLIFAETLTALLIDIKNKDPKLTLMYNAFKKQYKSQFATSKEED